MQYLKSNLYASIAFILMGAPSTLDAQSENVKLPKRIEFLNVLPEQIPGRFEIRSGEVYMESSDGVLVPAKLDGVKVPNVDGYGRRILGAPAVVLSEKEVVLPKASSRQAALLGDGVVFVEEKRLPSTTDVSNILTSFSVNFKRGEHAEHLATFTFEDNIFNQYLTEIFPIDERTLAIVTASSRHPYIHTLFLFDMKTRKMAGMTEFSKFQYLPASKSFWLMSSVVNCDNMDEALNAAAQQAVIVPLYTGNTGTEISEAIRQVGGIEVEPAQLGPPPKN